MTPRLIPSERDPVGRTDRPISIVVDGMAMHGVSGQSIAGVLLVSGMRSWRTGPSGERRGVFCGIGVCFDCVVTVNAERDVRACRRRARDGDVVATQSRVEPHQ